MRPGARPGVSRIQLAVAYLLRRAGAEEVTEEAFVNQVSLDLHWLSPKQGRRLLDAARALGYLTPGQAPRTVRAAFRASGVEVPIDFRLEPADLEDLPEGPAAGASTDELVAMAARAKGTDAERVWADVRRREADLFETPVAALLVAGEAGVDVRALARKVREELRHAAPRGAATSSASAERLTPRVVLPVLAPLVALVTTMLADPHADPVLLGLCLGTLSALQRAVPIAPGPGAP